MKKTINKFINRLSWGQFLVGKIQMVVSLTILLKVFDVAYWVYPVVAGSIVVFLYFLGWFFDKQLKESYFDQHYGNYKFRE